MAFDPDKHHRRSIRLKGYDYSQVGAYFVTIVTQYRVCLFGGVEVGEMRLSDAGRMLERWWLELNRKFPTLETDEYVVMPNHLHGIILIVAPGTDATYPNGGGEHAGGEHAGGEHAGGEHIGSPLRNGVCSSPTVGADLGVCPHTARPTVGADLGVCPHIARPTVGADLGVCPPTAVPLPRMVQWFKTMTSNEYIRGVKTLGWTPFAGKLWQRNYYEHIIRNEESLNRIRQYILDNPIRWAMDRENPEALTPEAEGPWLS